MKASTLLALLTAKALLVSSIAAASSTESVIERSLPAQPGKSLKVDVASATVRVTGTNQEDISLRATLRADTRDKEKAEKRFDLLDFSFEQTNSGAFLKLENENPGSDSSASSFNLDIEIELAVPKEFNLDIDTASGDVVLQNVAGNHRADTASGDVTITDCLGNHVVDTSSGDVEILRGDGSQKINTSSGKILVQSGNGSLLTDTTSGDITVRNFTGEIQVESTSGNADLDLRETPLSSDIHVDTTSGDIRLALHHELSANLNLTTSSGRITNKFTLDAMESKNSKRRIRGRIGQNGPTIKIISTSGNITLQ